jgi:hypothetical protein
MHATRLPGQLSRVPPQDIRVEYGPEREPEEDSDDQTFDDQRHAAAPVLLQIGQRSLYSRRAVVRGEETGP